MLSLLIAVTAAAQSVPGAPLPEADERIALPHVQSAAASPSPGEALANLDRALTQLPRPTRFRGYVQCMRGMLLFHLESEDAGYAAIDECYRLDPQNPRVQMIQGVTRTRRGDLRTGVPLMIAAMKADPDVGHSVNSNIAADVLRRLSYVPQLSELRRQLIVALVESGAAKDDPLIFSALAAGTMIDRVVAGGREDATQLLPAIVEPNDGLALLIDRRLEPVWPQIEEWAGRDLTAQRDALIRQARATMDLRNDRERRNDLASALGKAGEVREAMTVVRATQAETDLSDSDRFEAGQSAIGLSRLLAAAGEPDPAVIVAPMRAVLADGIGRQSSGLWNVVSNLARTLIALGRPAEALEVLDRFPLEDADIDDAAGGGYFVALRACALGRVGRHTEAAAGLREMRARYAMNRPAMGIVTYCLASEDEQAKFWLAEMEDPVRRGGALVEVARARLAYGLHDRDRVEIDAQAQRRLVGRADIAARYAALARDLPASFEPALRNWLPAD